MTEQNTNPKSKFRVVSVNEVFEQITQREKRWAEEKRIGTVSFDAEFNAVTFHFDEATERYRYYVYLDKLKTSEDQMRWLNHLRHKQWFTREVMNDFFDCLERLGYLENKL